MAASKRKSSGRKYGKAASKSVERAMHKRKAGTLSIFNSIIVLLQIHAFR